MHGYYGLLAPVQSWRSLLTPQAFSYAMSAIRGGYARGSAALQVAFLPTHILTARIGGEAESPRGQRGWQNHNTEGKGKGILKDRLYVRQQNKS